MKHIYTISAVYDGGRSSNDAKAPTFEEALKMIDLFKEMDHKARNCGGIKKGEVVEYSITKWTCDEDGDLDEMLEDELFERVTY